MAISHWKQGLLCDKMYGDLGLIMKFAYAIWYSKHQGPYLPTILKNVHSLVLQMFLYLAAFECNTTSDWLNQSEVHCVTFKLTTLGEIDKEPARIAQWLERST